MYPTKEKKTSLPLKKRTSSRVQLTSPARRTSNSRAPLSPPAKTSSRARPITQEKSLPVETKVRALQLRVGNPPGMRVSRCPRLLLLRLVLSSVSVGSHSIAKRFLDWVGGTLLEQPRVANTHPKQTGLRSYFFPQICLGGRL